jgi:hypothetical protein
MNILTWLSNAAHLGRLETRPNRIAADLTHERLRNALLVAANSQLRQQNAQLADAVNATRAQLASARRLLDERTHERNVAEGVAAEEYQRVRDLEEEARLWLTRQLQRVAVTEN